MRSTAALLFALSSCGLASTGVQPTQPKGEIILASDGLRVAGTQLEIGFGRAQKGALDAVAKLLDAQPKPATPTACGEVWSTPRSGLSLTFKSQTFVGWAVTSDNFQALPNVGTSAGETCPDMG